ncbi:MAG: HipA domain-containing protein [Oleibacter sp.]|nr:HipA domain-containing protein [Thalassolituus sp.]
MCILNFFESLLPDSESIQTRIQSKFCVANSHPFDLLAAVGRDCVGAIQLYPLGKTISDVKQVISDPLTDSDIEHLLSGYQQATLGMDDDHDFRISLADAREKTALLWHQGSWQRPLGSTPTSHIFKLPIRFLEPRNIDLRLSGENELLCLQILKEYGVPVPHAQLAQFGTQKALIEERFDQRWSSDR